MESLVTDIEVKRTEKKGFRGAHTKISWVKNSIEKLIIATCVINLVIF